MGDFVVGWDGGGTKTCVACVTADGVEIERRIFGALNVNGASEREIFSCVGQAVAFVKGVPGRCLGMVIATAGTSNPVSEELVGRALRDAGYAGPYAIHGDQEAALYGAVEGVGAVLVAGTGSICYGRNAAGETARCGYLVDDEGSGYAIGRDILTAVLRSHDGRNAPTALSALVFGTDKWRDIPTIMRTLYVGETDKSQVASLAPLLIQAGQDPAAQAISRKAAAELAGLCKTVVKKLRMPDARVALSGSILAHFEGVRGETTRRLLAGFPDLRFMDPLHDAAWGAALMARLAFGR